MKQYLLLFTLLILGFTFQLSAEEVSTKSIYPNPVLSQASFEISLKTQTIINIYIYNQIGQLIQFRTVNAQEGNSKNQILTNEFLSSVYTMKQIFDDGASINQKFVK